MSGQTRLSVLVGSDMDDVSICWMWVLATKIAL